MNEYNSIAGINPNPSTYLQSQEMQALGSRIYTYPQLSSSEIYNPIQSTQSQLGVFQQAATFVMAIISQAFQMFKGLTNVGSNNTASNSPGLQGNNSNGVTWEQVIKDAIPSLIASIFGPVTGAFGGLAAKAGSLIEKLF